MIIHIIIIIIITSIIIIISFDVICWQKCARPRAERLEEIASRRRAHEEFPRLGVCEVIYVMYLHYIN